MFLKNDTTSLLISFITDYFAYTLNSDTFAFPYPKIMQTVKQYFRKVLSVRYGSEEARAITNLVLEKKLDMQPYQLLMNEREILPDNQRAELCSIADRLSSGEPVQYILGEAEFCGATFHVTPDVLIPRPETAELVDWIVSEYNSAQSFRIMDIGTGSGCIAISIARMLPNSEVSAVDVSAAALSVASFNADINNVKIDFILADILNPDSQFPSSLDCIVSNPPYIMEKEKAEMEEHVLEHEPHLALFVSDSDPLLFYRTIAHRATKLLKPGGSLFFEINSQFGRETVDMLSSLGFRNIELRKDFFGKDRMVRASRITSTDLP